MRNSKVKAIALGGLLAAVAVVIMCIGTFIPVATYVCPMLCCIVQFVVLRYCGISLAWTWYVAVSVLCLLMAPDKEAALVFLAIGYYPLIKQKLERKPMSLFWKVFCFNVSIVGVYAIMIFVLGMQHLVQENMEFGLWGLAALLILGNITFLLLDRVLSLIAKKK